MNVGAAVPLVAHASYCFQAFSSLTANKALTAVYTVYIYFILRNFFTFWPTFLSKETQQAEIIILSGCLFVSHLSTFKQNYYYLF
jgi:hypothetical protein